MSQRRTTIAVQVFIGDPACSRGGTSVISTHARPASSVIPPGVRDELVETDSSKSSAETAPVTMPCLVYLRAVCSHHLLRGTTIARGRNSHAAAPSPAVTAALLRSEACTTLAATIGQPDIIQRRNRRFSPVRSSLGLTDLSKLPDRRGDGEGHAASYSNGGAVDRDSCQWLTGPPGRPDLRTDNLKVSSHHVSATAEGTLPASLRRLCLVTGAGRKGALSVGSLLDESDGAANAVLSQACSTAASTAGAAHVGGQYPAQPEWGLDTSDSESSDMSGSYGDDGNAEPAAGSSRVSDRAFGLRAGRSEVAPSVTFTRVISRARELSAAPVPLDDELAQCLYNVFPLDDSNGESEKVSARLSTEGTPTVDTAAAALVCCFDSLLQHMKVSGGDLLPQVLRSDWSRTVAK